jgi:hypothetical protein
MERRFWNVGCATVVLFVLAASDSRGQRPHGLGIEALRSGDMTLSTLDDAPAPDETYAASTDSNAVAENHAAEAAVECDCKKMKAVSKAAASAHAGVFWANNFGYLCDPCYCQPFLGDSLKRNCPNDWIAYDVGGQYRARYHNEHNFRGSGLTGVDDDFLLHRTRLYANVEVGQYFRFFGEMIDAESNYENFAPRGIEVNRADALNLFGEVLLYDNGCGQLWGRYGRFELLAGAQRTISPLDWANTRRTLEGGLISWLGSEWDVHAAWTRPVVVDPHNFDSADQSQEITGLYSTYKGIENETLDLYFIRYSESAAATEFDFNTFGLRYQGKRDAWMWEFEGAYQFGEVGSINQEGEAFTFGLGREFACICWKPTLWAYYDWASGDTQVGGVGNGYHHLIPLAHKYLGFMDLFGRRNIKDANLLLTLNPHEQLKLLAWYHIFALENTGDVPYSVGMAPLVATPGGSADLGQELDLVATWTFNERADVAFGYSHFFAGDFYATNGSVPFTGDADFFYTQFTVNF